jgi:hypothetical protein
MSDDASPLDPRAAELSHMAEKLGQRILQITTPVLREMRRGHPDYIGSAIGIRLGDDHFLLTAAHVADFRSESGLFGHGRSGLAPFEGEVTRVFANPPAESDHVDIAVFRLPLGAEEKWPAEFFAVWAEIDREWPPPERHSYLVAGFPVSRNRSALRGDTLSSQMYQLAGLDATPETYESHSRNREINLVLGFEKRRMHGPDGHSVAPDPYGMSGCGAWRVGRYLRFSTQAALLSAVMIEWQRYGEYPHLLGTRMAVILAAIFDQYPHLRAAVDGRSGSPPRAAS